MKKFKIRVACGIMILTLGIAGVAGCSPSELDGTETVATIGKDKISLGLTSLAVRHAQSQSENMYKQLGMGEGAEIWDGAGEGKNKTYGEETKNTVLETLEKMYLVRERAAEYKVELSKEEKTKIKEAAKAFIEGNDAAVLERMGVTQKDAQEYMELHAYYEKAFDPILADKTIEVSDEEAKQSTVTYSYLTTQDMEEEAKAEVKGKMEALLKEYKEQEDIAAFDMTAHTDAKNESESENFMTTTVSFGEDEEDTSVDAAVKTAVKDLKDGQLYDGVVEGSAGYFVVRMDKVFDQEATNSKKESLTETKRQEEFDKIVDGWLKEADIKVNKSIWKKIKLTDKESYSMPTAEATPQASGSVEEGGSEADATETPAEEGATETPAAEGATETPAAEGATETPAAEGATEAPAETPAE